MSWYDSKSTAADPDNPTADEQIPATEWNAMVLYLKDKIIDKTVNAAAIGDNKILVYKTSTSTFVFESPSTITSINDIADVTITGTPADNEVLAYDTATSKWINQTAAEAGLALVANVVLEADFAATTFLYATADNTPQPKTVAETLAILSVESGADVTDATNVAAAGAVMDSDISAGEGFLRKTGAGAYTAIKSNMAAAVAPTANEDSGDGYAVGSRWHDTTADKEYVCLDSTVAAAVWTETTVQATTMAALSGTAAAEFLFNTQKIGGIVDPTTAQQGATKNYADTRVATKELTTNFTNNYVLVYKTASGKFEMEEESATTGLPVADTTAIVKGSADGTKLVRFEVDGLTTGTTRVMTVPDKNITLCDTAEVLLLTGGTLSGSVLFSGTPLVKLDMDTHSVVGIAELMLSDAYSRSINAGVINANRSYHMITTEGAGPTDDLDTINNGTAGQILIIKAQDSAHTIVVKNGTGNLKLSADMTLDNQQDTLTLIYDGSNWLEIARSNNGA